MAEANGAGTGDAGSSNATPDTADPATQTAPAAVPDANGSPSAGTNADPFAELDQDTRDWIKARHDNDVTKLAKQARELDKVIGSNSVRVPAADADQSEWDKFFDRAGETIASKMAPDAADKYGFEVPEGLPETVPYDADRDKAYANKALELKLSPKQAKGLREWFISDAVAASGSVEEQMKEQLGKTVETAKAKLVDRWGPMDGDRFRANIELADRAFRAIDQDGELKEELSALGLIGPNKEIFAPALAKAFAHMGAALYQEDTKVSGDPAMLGNPFESGSGFNLTQASRIVKEDPQRARQMIKAAGKSPDMFGLSP